MSEISQRPAMEQEGGEGTELPRKRGTSFSRRTFAIGVGSTVVLLGLGSLRYVGSTPLVRPPGGQDEDALISKCVHCYRCVEACPYDLIRPAKPECGIVGMHTPRMEFSDNYPGVLDAMKYCDFCARENGGIPLCAEVCPSTALSLPADFDSQTARIGVAELDSDLCLAYRSGYCSYCRDACVQVRGEEHAAISFKEEKSADGSVSQVPVVNPDLCNGCGACESVCISTQAGSALDAKVRAIVVKPLTGEGGKA